MWCIKIGLFCLPFCVACMDFSQETSVLHGQNRYTVEELNAMEELERYLVLRPQGEKTLKWLTTTEPNLSDTVQNVLKAQNIQLTRFKREQETARTKTSCCKILDYLLSCFR